MKAMRGKANPKVANEVLKQKLENSFLLDFAHKT